MSRVKWEPQINILINNTPGKSGPGEKMRRDTKLIFEQRQQAIGITHRGASYLFGSRKMNKKCKYIILMAALLSSAWYAGEMFILMKKHLGDIFSQTGVCNGAFFLPRPRRVGWFEKVLTNIVTKSFFGPHGSWQKRRQAIVTSSLMYYVARGVVLSFWLENHAGAFDFIRVHDGVGPSFGAV